MYPSSSVSATPVRMPVAIAAVNTEAAGAASSVGVPSKEYSVAREAVSTTRPRPWPTSSLPSSTASSPFVPVANAPLKQQSRITTCRRARHSSSWSSSHRASTPVEASRSFKVSVAAK